MNFLNRFRSMRTFLIIWVGQLFSLTGSQLTGFALGVWVYQQTDSVTQFTLISLFAVLPNLLISPLAGPLVDRWDRRRTMILSDVGSGLSTLTMAGLLFSGQLEVWHIYIAAGVSSLFSAFQAPAYMASISLLVPPSQLGRANGMVQMAHGLAQLIAPAIAGFLVVSIGLQGVMLVDAATLLLAISSLLLVRIPRPAISAESAAVQGSLLEEARYGWRYLTARPGLLGLMLFFAITYFFIDMVGVLVTPLVLSFTSATVLGVVMSIGGLGMLAGSLVMSSWGGPRRRIYAVLGFAGLMGLAIIVGGLRPSVPLFMGAAFLAFFTIPIFQGASQTILQRKVDPSVQGRIFALQGMISGGLVPLAYLSAGPLADRLFEPLLAAGGPLGGSLGLIIGVGPGRGMGLLFIVMGSLTLLTALGGWLHPRLRRVELELPDVLGEAGESTVTSTAPRPGQPTREAGAIQPPSVAQVS